MSNLRKLAAAVGVLVASAVTIIGCHDDTPTSPNAATAAPARLPGEDPHAPPDRVRRHEGNTH